MSALTMMPKVVAVLRFYAHATPEQRAFDGGVHAEAILAELAADGINVSAPPKVPEPKA